MIINFMMEIKDLSKVYTPPVDKEIVKAVDDIMALLEGRELKIAQLNLIPVKLQERITGILKKYVDSRSIKDIFIKGV
jgi:hypothetical protein